MRALIVIVLASCAARMPALPATHVASPQAPTGRLAGAPPALRAGVVDYKDVPVVREGPPADGGHHHQH